MAKIKFNTDKVKQFNEAVVDVIKANFSETDMEELANLGDKNDKLSEMLMMGKISTLLEPLKKDERTVNMFAGVSDNDMLGICVGILSMNLALLMMTAEE